MNPTGPYLNHITELNKAPWCYYGSIKVMFSNLEINYGSCFQIDDYTLITSAHLFESRNPTTNLTDMVSKISSIHYSAKCGKEKYDNFLTKDLLFVPGNYFHRINAVKNVNDYAILRLPIPIIDEEKIFIKPTNFENITSGLNLSQQNEIFAYVYGFPLMMEDINSNCVNEQFRDILKGYKDKLVVDEEKRFIEHRTSLHLNGLVGCPYLIVLDNKYYSIAIHKGYSNQKNANFGLLFTDGIIKLIDIYTSMFREKNTLQEYEKIKHLFETKPGEQLKEFYTYLANENELNKGLLLK